jgi:hypothetical protein
MAQRTLQSRNACYGSLQEGKEEDKKENRDQKALYLQIKQGDQIVGDSGCEGKPSKIVVMRDEHSKEFRIFLARVTSHQETFFKELKD